MLPDPLKPLGELPQWILWRLVQRTGKKPDKVPVSPHTGEFCDAHDPNMWVSYDMALSRVASMGATGVGFVITKAAGYWFLDIDECRQPDGNWSQVAQTLCNLLVGCAVEISQSGNGLHLFGRGRMPPHGCKNADLGIELYNDGRFVALTGIGAIGNCDYDVTSRLTVLVDQYFPVDIDRPDGPGLENWQDVADPAWRGPADDQVLLARMFGAKASVGHVLMGRASPRQMWDLDIPALSAAFPSDDGRAYDASRADESLCQHLAFWTGKNTERMRRLLWMSGLRRDKWEKHRTYLWRTVTAACARQATVYQERGGEPVPATAADLSQSWQPNGQRMVLAPAADAGPAVTLVPRRRAGGTFITIEMQPEYFHDCIYIMDQHKIHSPFGLLKPDQFKVMYSGYDFSTDNENSKMEKDAWVVFTSSRAIEFPKVEGSCFRPESGSWNLIVEDGRRLLNVYKPLVTRRTPGDPSKFLNHLARMIPDEGDRQILVSWMAMCVQCPGVKMQWWPVIQGTQGNGKSTIGRILEQAVGRLYTHMPKAAQLGESGMKFSAWLQNKLLLIIEEIKVDDRVELMQAMLDLVTNPRIEIQGKGADQIMGDNRANGIMFTNHKDAIPVTIDTRRYCIFWCRQQRREDIINEGWTGDYFPRLYSWLENEGYAIITDYLANYRIPEWMQATLMGHAPDTTSTLSARHLTLGRAEQEVLEAIESHTLGFAGGWVSSEALDRLLIAKRLDRGMPHAKRRTLLQNLGYDWHPALPEGRATGSLLGLAARPKIFVRNGSVAAGLRDPARVMEEFVRANSPAQPTFPVFNQTRGAAA